LTRPQVQDESSMFFPFSQLHPNISQEYMKNVALNSWWRVLFKYAFIWIHS